MSSYIAFLQGINVGGHRRLPMDALRQLVRQAGYEAVQTYLQTGNVVFRSNAGGASAFAMQVSKSIGSAFGFCPTIMVVRGATLAQLADANPFPEATQTPKLLHLYFLATQPPPGALEAVQQYRQHGEAVALAANVLYLYAPHGIGRSKLVQKLPQALGVSTTGRNWQTVVSVLAMASKGT